MFRLARTAQEARKVSTGSHQYSEADMVQLFSNDYFAHKLPSFVLSLSWYLSVKNVFVAAWLFSGCLPSLHPSIGQEDPPRLAQATDVPRDVSRPVTSRSSDIFCHHVGGRTLCTQALPDESKDKISEVVWYQRLKKFVYNSLKTSEVGLAAKC